MAATKNQLLREGLVCQGCGAPLPATRSNRAPKWCSERCRKRQYGDPCVDCGARTRFGAERARVPEPRCVKHAAIALHAEQRALIERLWAQGLPAREIAAQVGFTGTYATHWAPRLRQLGYDLPHRYSPERVERIAAANRAHVARRWAA